MIDEYIDVSFLKINLVHKNAHWTIGIQLLFYSESAISCYQTSTDFLSSMDITFLDLLYLYFFHKIVESAEPTTELSSQDLVPGL